MTKLREKLQSAAAVFTSSGAAGSVRSRSERFSLQRQILAARIAFFTGGFTVAAWAPLIPFVRNGLLLDEFRLGLLLFGLGLGSFFGMPFAGSLSERYGSRHALAFSGIGSCILLILLATVPNYYVECALLFLYGVVLSSLEVSANIYGTHLERLSGRRLLSGLHAGYSVGAMSAAAVVSLLFMSGASPLCAITIAMTGSMTTGMAQVGQYVVTYSNGDDQVYSDSNQANSLRIGFELLHQIENWANYDKAMEAYSHIDEIVAEGKKECLPAAQAWAAKEKDEPVFYVLASGPNYGVAYSMCCCHFMEMQWKHAV